jgi:integrase
MSVNVRRHPRGGWDVDINVLLVTGDRHRERRKLSASYSKTTAREWGLRRERELLLTGPKVRKEVPTLEAFAPRFIEGYARANRQKPSGVAAKESILRLHLVPELGSRALDTISNEQVQRLKSRLHDKSPKTINNVLSVLNVLLKQAVEWGVLEKMPCSIRLVRVPRTDAAFHDFDDYERLLKAALTIDPRSYLIALLGGEAGLRAGEIVALEWADVDLERRQIRVRHSDWCGELTAPKNGRIRFAGMTERLAAAIRQQRHLRSRRVLCKDDGTPITRQGAWSRVRYAAKRAKVPTGVHILRHTFCSHLADAGRTDAWCAGARRASEPRDDSTVLPPESRGPRRDDQAARKPRDVARSWRQFGDAEGVKLVTCVARTR